MWPWMQLRPASAACCLSSHAFVWLHYIKESVLFVLGRLVQMVGQIDVDVVSVRKRWVPGIASNSPVNLAFLGH